MNNRAYTPLVLCELNRALLLAKQKRKLRLFEQLYLLAVACIYPRGRKGCNRGKCCFVLFILFFYISLALLLMLLVSWHDDGCLQLAVRMTGNLN